MSTGEDLTDEDLTGSGQVIHEHTRYYNFEMLVNATAARVYEIETDGDMDWDEKHEAIGQVLYSTNSKLEEYGFINADAVIGEEDAIVPRDFDLTDCMIGDDYLFGPYWGMEYVPLDDIHSEWKLVHQVFLGTKKVMAATQRGYLEVMASLPVESSQIWLFESQELRLPGTPKILEICEPLYSMGADDYDWNVIDAMLGQVKAIDSDPAVQRKNIDWFLKELDDYINFGSSMVTITATEFLTRRVTHAPDDSPEDEPEESSGQSDVELFQVPQEGTGYTIPGRLLGITEIPDYEMVAGEDPETKVLKQDPSKTCLAIVVDYYSEDAWITAMIPLRHCKDVRGVFGDEDDD